MCVGALAAGCTLEPLVVEPDDSYELELEALVLEAVQRPMAQSLGFERVNASPSATELHATDQITVFAPADVIADYRRVDPNRSGSGVSLPEGTVIVREVWAAEGSMVRLTVMAKGAPGYFPGGGDYFYGVLSPDGTRFESDDEGRPLRGRVEVCGTCHLDRSGDDFLFGVPETVRQ